MYLADGENERMRSLLEPLLHGVVTEARLSPLGGSWITIEIDGSLIWIHMTAWLIEGANEFMLACEDSRELIDVDVRMLDGRTLTAIAVSPFLDLTLDFDGVKLVTFTTSGRADSKHWSVQLSSGVTLFAGPGRRWSCEETR